MSNKYVYGIDVGGTAIKIGLFNIRDMKLIFSDEIATPLENQETSIFNAITRQIELINENNNVNYDDVLGIGLAVPCPIKDGFVKTTANIKWKNKDVKKDFEALVPKHVKVIVANDASVAAFGENQVLAKPYKDVVFYTLGTGVGGGIIIDGKLVEGVEGFASEIGHMFVSDDIDYVCGCGKKGCLEQFSASNGILTYAQNLLEQDYPSSLRNVELEKKISVKDIFDAAKKGDDLALKIVDRAVKYIAISAANLAVILNPEVFIIGGGIAKAGDFLLDKIVKEFKKIARFETGSTPFILAHTMNQAGIIGAAYLAKSISDVV